MNDPQVLVSYTLSKRDIALLQRLPSVKERRINVEKTSMRNEVAVVRDISNQRVLLVTYYHNFENFVYMHTAIGRDRYKDLLYYHLLAITTDLAPTYCVIFKSPASLRANTKYGATEVFLDEIDQTIPDFVDQIADLTGNPFYRNGNILMHRDDKPPVKNPLYLITKAAYQKSLQKLACLSQSNQKLPWTSVD